MITDKQSIANIFNKHFVNITSDIKEPKSNCSANFEDHPSISAILANLPEDASSNFDFTLCNTVIVEKCLQEIRMNKSSGYDGIIPRLLKDSASIISGPLCSIFNTSIITGHYPNNWKKGQVTPVFKKDDEFSTTNYRPISVLLAINNVFEKLLATQLNSHFNRILADNSSAYRKHHSCQTALLRLVEDWKDCLDKDLMVAVISIDLSKAFDSLPHNLLLAKLKAYGLTKPACILLGNFLNGRQQRVEINDTFSPWMSLTRGVPQGSVLSPLLFNIFINDIFYFVRHARLNICADDQQIYDSDKDPMTLHLRMENELTTIVNWYAINGLKANPEKFQAMILEKKTYDFHFKIGNVEIDKETSINLLGVNLDNKLNFSKHISNICARVHNQIQVIKRFRHILSSSTEARLYKAFIKPHFQYCSTIWHFCGARNSEKLELLNKHALRIILNDNVSFGKAGPYRSD